MSEEIPVAVKMLSMGLKTIECNVRRDHTVEEFKTMVAIQEGKSNGDHYRLTYENKELTNGSQLLGDLKPAIEEWCVFTIVLKPVRSSPSESHSIEEVHMSAPSGMPAPSAPPQQEIHHNVSPVTTVRHVKVQLPSGTLFHTTVRELGNISELKGQIWSETGHTVDHQKLLFNGTILPDTRGIASFGNRGRSYDNPILVTLVVQSRVERQIQFSAGVRSVDTAIEDDAPLRLVTAKYKTSDETVHFSIRNSSTVLELKRRISEEFYNNHTVSVPSSIMEADLKLGQGKVSLDDNNNQILSSLDPLVLQHDSDGHYIISFKLIGDKTTFSANVGVLVGVCIAIPGFAVMIAGIAMFGLSNIIVGAILLANGFGLCLTGALIACITGNICCNCCDVGTGDYEHRDRFAV